MQPERSPRPWHLEAGTRDVVAGERRTRLAEKPFRVLAALVEAEGRVVSRAELRRVLWSDDTFVDFDNNLNSAVATLRQALGDSGRTPTYIETLPKVGYRLLVLPSAAPAERGATWWRRAVAIAVLGAVAAAAGALVLRPGAGDGRLPDARPDALAELQRGDYLRAQWSATERDPALLERARSAFARARALDPELEPLAAAREAETVVDLAFAGAVRLQMGLEEARALAGRALAGDRENGTAMRVLAMSALVLDWDVRSAESWIARAERRTPGDARTALAHATILAATGRAHEAVRLAERAVALDPAANFVRADLALFQLAAGDPGSAAATSRSVLDVAPASLPALVNVVLAHERLADHEPAADAARRLLDLTAAPPGVIDRARTADAADVVRVWHEWDLTRVRRAAGNRVDEYALSLALRSAATGNRDATFAYLDRALARRDVMLVFLRLFAEFGPLRSDPRFEAIARRVLRG